RILAYALPHDGVRDAWIGTDEDEDVGLLEIGIRIRRRVESEGLLVRNDRRRHALARVAVAVHHAHTELAERAQERKLLRRALPGAEPRHRFRPVFGLNLLETRHERIERRIPLDRYQAPALVTQERSGRAILGAQWRQRLPPFGARHSHVDRVRRRG